MESVKLKKLRMEKPFRDLFPRDDERTETIGKHMKKHG